MEERIQEFFFNLSLQVNEWLCLNCQTQRALNGMEPQEPQKINTHEQPDNVYTSALHPRTEIITPAPLSLVSANVVSDVAETQKKEIQAAAIPDKTKGSVNVQKKESPKLPESNIKAQPASSQKKETSDPKKDKEIDTLLKEANKSPEKSAPPPQAEPPKQEQSFFGFGFGGPKVQPASSKPPESTTGKIFGFGGLTETARSRSPSPQSVSAVSGRVLGFGSSIFSSASNLINSAVQDESSITPPTSRKGSTVSQVSARTTPPSSRKGSAVTPDSSKIPPVGDTKPHAVQNVEKTVEKKPETKQVTEPKPPQKPAPKEVKTNCPLCKVELNIGSKDAKNFNTCTECKTTVCSQCGFNPLPHQTEVRHLTSTF